jgi:hypothetical protein
MNKQELKHNVKERVARLQNSLLRSVAEFPEGWGERHVGVAIRALVNNPEMTTGQVIAEIKKGWACHGENWRVDRG